MNEEKAIKNSLEYLDLFFKKHSCQYWLEAGTALSAYRDGSIFPWDHDIDVAIWKKDMPNLDSFSKYFNSKGYKVIIQKEFPFVDNIIQLKVEDELSSELFDVDIYLYTRHQRSAYMRWIQKPEGFLANTKGRLVNYVRCFVNPKTEKWKSISSFFPFVFKKIVFTIYLIIHINTSKCIYHKFPEIFFIEFQEIEFYGMKVLIPKDIENFLKHRYGNNWIIPDNQFNQTGKWKNVDARVELKMNLLPNPRFDDELIDFK